MIRDRLTPYHAVVSVLGDSGGLHVVVRGHDARFDTALQRALIRHAVQFQSIAKLAVTAPRAPGFMLGYGHMDVAELRAALDLLEACILAVSQERTPNPTRTAPRPTRRSEA
jgi:DNA-binding transcriptional MocR family regulator